MSTPNRSVSVDALGEIAVQLEECESIDAVYTHAIRLAERILTFDSAAIHIQQNGRFVPRSTHTTRLIPSEPVSTDQGVAGRTLETGRTQVVRDCREEPLAIPTCRTFRSVLSIPLEDDGVLQFFSTETDAFSPLDRERGELLAATIANACARVRYETALNAERDQFAALFQNLSDAALQYRTEDGTRVIDAVNSAFVRVFGYEADAVLGKPISTVLRIQGETDHDETSDRADIEVVLETASGPRPFLRRSVPIPASDGERRGYRLYTDLTDLKVRERELERQNERLDQFARIVSHDLRNPLTVANGYLELVRDELGADHEAVMHMQQSHERMEALIEDVLAGTRESTDLSGLEPVNLEQVARDAWEHVETTGATLRVDDADVWIDADPTRLLQLFENLFRNAVEHGRTDDPPEIYVRVTAGGSWFCVDDNGPGVPEDEREAVFESGYSTDEENTGLGLAIVERITTEHRWTVSIEDSEWGGARFRFDGVYPTERADADSISTPPEDHDG